MYSHSSFVMEPEPAKRQCVTCRRSYDSQEFITLTATGRVVNSCRSCRISSKRKHDKQKLQQAHIKKRVERLKCRVESMYEALPSDLRNIIDHALLEVVVVNKTTEH